MATLIPFCDLISLFLSIQYDNDYEESFWNEIYGCVNYLAIPYETVMSMPIHIRKLWIRKHNAETEKRESESNGGNGTKNSNGEFINSFALLEQNRM